MNDKNRALILTFEFPPYPGGIGTYAYQMACKFQAMGMLVDVMAPPTHDTYQDDQSFDEEQPFNVYRFRHWNFRLALIIGRLLQILAICRRNHYDWIFCGSYRPAVGAFVCKLFWDTPYFIMGHGSEYRKFPNWMVPLLKQASALFANSHYTSGLMQTHCSDCEISVIPLGADVEQFNLKPDIQNKSLQLRKKYDIEGNPVLLSVGRLDARKGHDITLKGLKKIKAVCPDVKLIVIGKSMPGAEAYEAELYRIISRNNLSKNVMFIPVVSPEELALFYYVTDVFILASRYSGRKVEGFGIVLIEANLMETPVIAAKSGGIPDAVEDGKTGFLFENENPEDLADKVLCLLKNNRGKEMGIYGRQRALKEFNWHVVAEKTINVIQDKIPDDLRK